MRLGIRTDGHHPTPPARFALDVNGVEAPALVPEAVNFHTRRLRRSRWIVRPDAGCGGDHENRDASVRIDRKVPKCSFRAVRRGNSESVLRHGQAQRQRAAKE